MSLLQKTVVEQHPFIRSECFQISGQRPTVNTFPVMKPCGHVTCKACTETLVRSSGQCIACDRQLKHEDILELSREGQEGIYEA